MRVEKIGDAELWLGDCRELLPTLGRVDCVVTDPPYGVEFKANTRNKIQGGILNDVTPPELAKLAEMPCIIWGGNNFCDQLPRSTGWLVWFKHHPDSAEHSQAELAWTNCVRTVRHYSQAYHGFMRASDGWHHPTQKPPELMEWCLGFLPNSHVILDPFMGSGTTGVACARLGRRFIGIEIEEKYFSIACRRIEAEHRRPRLPLGEPAPQPVQEALL